MRGASEAFDLVRLYAREHGIALLPDHGANGTGLRVSRAIPESVDITPWLRSYAEQAEAAWQGVA